VPELEVLVEVLSQYRHLPAVEFHALTSFRGRGTPHPIQMDDPSGRGTPRPYIDLRPRRPAGAPPAAMMQHGMKGSVEYINPDSMVKSPAFSQAVVVAGPVKTVYVGAQNAVDGDR